MTESLIKHSLEGIQARIASAEKERAELDRVIMAAREEERLLLRLLALRRGAAPEQDDRPPRETPPTNGSKPAGSEDVKHPVVHAVVRELAAAGRPLHISDLMRLLHDAGVPIPGAGTQANLISHLRRDPRLVRPSRGMYGLSTWGLENMRIGTQRKRRKKRVSSGSTMARNEP